MDRLTHKALEDGHHVYYHDGNKLHTTNPENIDTHLDSYFGDDKNHSFDNKHMILSKKNLLK